MAELCNVQINVNNQQTFFINEKILTKFSGKMKKIVNKQQNLRNAQQKFHEMKNLCINMDDFPGGPNGFELISRYCYNNSNGVEITVSNVSLLHCCSIYLEMNLMVSKTENLLQRTETFLEGMFYWPVNDVLTCLKSCDSFFDYANSIGFLQKMIFVLVGKLGRNSSGSSSSSFSSSETNSGAPFFTSSKPPWWFSELTILPPKIVQQFINTFEGHFSENTNSTVTKFLIYYLKATIRTNRDGCYVKLAEKAVDGVISSGKTEFSCRGVFWVLRVIVSGFDLKKDFRNGVEKIIGEMLDKATLDDLLVSSNYHHGCVYDVNLVIRLIKAFVDHHRPGVQKMKKVGALIDEYLREISPDHNLKVSKFLGVAESLPDSARDCFDGVYRAIDIYLQSHPNLSMEERSNLCRCLNYEKLTLETCKDLAKNPKIPPRITIQALISQQVAKVPTKTEDLLSLSFNGGKLRTKVKDSEMGMLDFDDDDDGEDVRMHLANMQWRVIEFEKVCRNMGGQMVNLSKSSPIDNRGLLRLC